MIEIEIDGKLLEVEQGSMIIEAADNAGIHIPRFCYHKKLSIAANCRMCLVDVEKAPKPLPACATPVTAGMKVYTRSAKAKDSQRSVMEFLLINHPLDCPICDQGGECELQDLSLGYGQDVSRYNEGKRSVVDEDIGPLVETEMTRCIQCTRCVRFGTEVAGLRELGATGRGEKLRIGTYVKHSLQSEMSGNIIDLCPVGALTSKPYRFKARAWELTQKESIAPHDCIGSNIYIHHRQQEVMRVVPRENEVTNETWISDRDRFSYLGLRSTDRIQKPLIKINDNWQETDWTSALEFAVQGLKEIIAKAGAEQIAALVSPSATTEEHYLLQKIMRALGSNNIDHRLHQIDVADQNDAPLYPRLGVQLPELEAQDIILLIGTDVQREAPIAGHRIRKAVARGANVLSVNVINYSFNFAQAETLIVSPNYMALTLAGIAKSLMTNNPAELTMSQQALLADIKPTAEQQKIAEQLKADQKKFILLGAIAQNHPQASHIRALAQLIAKLSKATLGSLTEGANSAGAWLAGAIPHRSAAGVNSEAGFTAQAALAANLRAYILLGIEPELDCANGYLANNAMQQADFVIALSSFKSDSLMQQANVILPIAVFAENEGTLINAVGDWQVFNAVVPAPGDTKLGWKVLRVLGNQLKLPHFDYNTAAQIRTELQTLIDKVDVKENWYDPKEIKAESASALMRITEWPIYAVDSLVRRAKALQESATNTPAAIYIHEKLAERLKVEAGKVVTIVQGEAKAQLPVMFNSQIPEDCVWIPAGREETAGLGETFGAIEIQI